MTERLYTLAEITDVLGQALKRVPAVDRLICERPLNLFLDDVVLTLKALPENEVSKQTRDASLMWSYPGFLSPND